MQVVMIIAVTVVKGSVKLHCMKPNYTWFNQFLILEYLRVSSFPVLNTIVRGTS